MKTLILVMAGAGVLFGQANASRQSITFSPLSAVAVTKPVNLSLVAHKHTIQAVVTGSPAGCSIQLEGTLDDANSTTATWANLSGAQDCTSTVTFHVVDKPVSGIRVNLTALSGGSSPTVKVSYVGVQ